ncbi:SDR family oxidoreductase [Sediminitomix flava]|uniref:NADP-dependent 3-hydroxy acid dehydrogenase YdfG n=1 Tax=Sediminitomix flava TaxID=379075 RepID=A0A315Z7X6_SEDFL|nr:SDR family oxidoreductase [Sediminitomix flava]PWJ40151.1 NADP-dependent 3-hydroxy acid dehydrogenase YdfG [Sediminitomix flava]
MSEKPLVVITGASSGIGEATAKLFSEKGYPLLLLARRIDKMEALNLPNTLCRKLDVTDRDAFKLVIKEAEDKFGPVDCLVNNAGLMQLSPFVAQNPTEWDNMIDVNVKGLLNGMHAVLESMYERKHGSIYNVSSVAGIKIFPNHSVYCGTKFSVHAISDAVREEAGANNVRVAVIAPGAVETELLGHTTNNDIIEGYEEWKKQIGGALIPEDIAHSILYAYEQPQRVNIREIVITCTGQEA